MNNIDTASWVIDALGSLRDFAQESERDLIVDCLDEIILTIANENYRLDAKVVKYSEFSSQFSKSIKNDKHLH